MEMFSSTFGFVGAVVLGVVILTVFFKLLGLFSSKKSVPTIIKMNGFLKDAAWINVHLAGGKLLERVKFIGYTDPSSAKGGYIPYQLSNMLVLETGLLGHLRRLHPELWVHGLEGETDLHVLAPFGSTRMTSNVRPPTTQKKLRMLSRSFQSATVISVAGIPRSWQRSWARSM